MAEDPDALEITPDHGLSDRKHVLAAIFKKAWDQIRQIRIGMDHDFIAHHS
jgi:hypothetical protein